MRNLDRLGVALILLVAIGLDRLDRYQLAPPWLAEAIFAIILIVMLTAAITRSSSIHRIELIALWGCVVLGFVYNALNLGNVINRLVFQAVKPSTLFFTALTIWINNVLIFTLLYWLLDGGGPDARTSGTTFPDFDFPAASEPKKVRPGWRPALVDYFFLGFTTATAFSPTEAQPLTPRAKLLMIAESALSLTNIAIVAARAINIIQ